MATSVYATPPPDLSGEEALSDVSNSSQTNSSNSLSKATKRTLSIASLITTSTTTNTTNQQQTTTTCYQQNNNVNLSPTTLDNTVPDPSKKRRKQSTPIRISAGPAGTTTEDGTTAAPSTTTTTTDDNPSSNNENIENLENELKDAENNFDQMKQFENGNYENFLNCDHCDKRFDSEIRLQMHLISEHIPRNYQGNLSESSLNIKKEPTSLDGNDWNSSGDDKINHKPEDWISLTGLPFPFSSEAAAAAALSATGYLPQMPLLGVPSASHFGMDGMSRSNQPPLRIFNPEAYCDLCNKEFCNKYFLKTHKANKHGIYEPPISANDMPTPNQINQMSQVYQMQQQQQLQQVQLQQQQQLQQPIIPSQPQPQHSPQLMPPEPAVFCDVCFKRFTNVFAMRRHRTKTHEMPQNPTESQKTDDIIQPLESGECVKIQQPFRLPEGFREDYQIEQEDTTFSPQPRKMSPKSSQLAKEANFNAEKLKRLGVINPEAFCEICYKEYCNKYFLRTHKLKRHGIFLPPDDTTTLMKDERSPWQQFVQTSPLNLIMGPEQQIIQHHQLQQQQQQSFDEKSSKDETMIADEKIDDELLKSDEIKKEIKDVESRRSSTTTPPIDRQQQLQQQQESEAISVDLQKLQSMILQLNDLSSPRAVSCQICGKEMENQYILHTHMITEHANIGDNNNGIKSSEGSSPIPLTEQIEICNKCDKEFPNLYALKQHCYEIHGIQATSPPIREGFLTPERPPLAVMSMPNTPTQSDRRGVPYTVTPTSSYCEICNKELCNKYFMKTHMQRMHGIEIENGAQIGGVVCNICNKELCSKYFLRVHKHNTHGIVEEGSPLPQPRQNGDQNELDLSFPIDGALKPGEMDINNRYYTHFTEVCPLCSRRFKNSKWLRLHLTNDHGKIGAEKLREMETRSIITKPQSPTIKIPNGGFGLNSPEQNLLNKNVLSGLFDEQQASMAPRMKEFQCSYCPFSTPYLAVLFIHERCHLRGNGASTPQNQSELAVSMTTVKDQQKPEIITPTTTPTPASTPIPLTPQEAAININVNSKSEISNNVLSEMANMSHRPAIYAIPQEIGPMQMQSFLVEEVLTKNNDSSDSSATRFVPAIIFLPVKDRIQSPVTVSFSLTPA